MSTSYNSNVEIELNGKQIKNAVSIDMYPSSFSNNKTKTVGVEITTLEHFDRDNVKIKKSKNDSKILVFLTRNCNKESKKESFEEETHSIENIRKYIDKRFKSYQKKMAENIKTSVEYVLDKISAIEEVMRITPKHYTREEHPEMLPDFYTYDELKKHKAYFEEKLETIYFIANLYDQEDLVKKMIDTVMKEQEE